jgi:hypothetical protein
MPVKSMPGQVIPPAPSDQPIPGRKRGLAPLIRSTKTRYPELSEAQIAKRVDCTPQNVSQVLAAFLSERTTDELQDFQGSKADIYDTLQYRALASITQDKLDNSSAMQLVTVAAILEDKGRLVRGQPTSLHVTALIDVLKAIRSRREQGHCASSNDE